MLFKPLLGDQLSGSVGGVTASHNAGGAYFRQRAIPVNPNTTQQQAVRSYFANCAAAWNGTLSQAQRDGWSSYAENTPITNRIGEPIILPGLAMYQRCNVPRLQAGLARADDGPTTFGQPEFTAPTLTSFSEASQELTLAFTTGDDWVGQDGAGMLVSISRPKGPAINYFKGPYRFADSIDGDSGTPPTSPATIASPFTFVETQKMFVKVLVSDEEGRLSAVFRGGIVAIA